MAHRCCWSHTGPGFMDLTREITRECSFSPFSQCSSTSSIRKLNHYLLTPYLYTPSQEWKKKSALHRVWVCSQPSPFPSPCMVLLCSCEGTGKVCCSSQSLHLTGVWHPHSSNPLSCWGKTADSALFHRLSPNPAGCRSAGIILD